MMLNSFLFTAERSERVEDWRAALEDLDGNELLWIALRDASEEEESALCEGLALGEQARRLRESPERACVTDDGEHLYATLYAVGGDAHAPELIPIECVIGPNWLLTAHRDEVAVLEEFLERAEGGGQVGQLDCPVLCRGHYRVGHR